MITDTPDVVGEGVVICPCGDYQLVFPIGTAAFVRATFAMTHDPAIVRRCPACHKHVLEVWRKP